MHQAMTPGFRYPNATIRQSDEMSKDLAYLLGDGCDANRFTNEAAALRKDEMKSAMPSGQA
jgi:hypothetical protein